MKKFEVHKRLREESSIQDILKIIIKENNLESGIDNLDVKNAWRSILGPGIANYTQDVFLKRNTLYVALSSPIVREELTYGKSKIIALLNEELGKEVVKDIVFR
ncbi:MULTISPECIES: DUF721 domain-containing protein [Myroides]|uniref:DUF721 domain-containing protein n=1 Tax=Myroides albus TaxID=2562892 RepID=A0A6I3LH05_9FLAO|nr:MULTISPECIES: DUF721 domain-containing protein [Myroides]MTG98849.1 DUF721 domain-containing protein [Myroides albus]MVX34504.1 DUF721 domain-containing protein [Myroides sp. LoEW2-1]UVD80454.1 DUF721 domain-containing protein [Myroides albus]